MESLVSREATFLFNNLLLVGIAFAVLWGVLFPLISEAVRRRPAQRHHAVLRVLRGRVRAAAGVPDGRRAADRVAAGVDQEPASGRSGAGADRRWPPGALLVLFGYGTSSAGRGGDHRCARSSPSRSAWSSRAARAPGGRCGRVVAARARLADRQEPAALRRLHRPPGDGAAGDRRRWARRPTPRSTRRRWRPGQSLDVQDYTLTFDRPDGVGGRRTTRRRVRS